MGVAGWGSIGLVQLFQDLGIGHQHTLGHGAVHFLMELGIGDHGSHQIHGQTFGPLLLGEVVLTVSLEKLVVCPHEAAHLVDQVPEDLHTANTQEILGAGIFVRQGIGQIGAQSIDRCIRVLLIRGNTGENVVSHLGTAFQDHLEVGFPAVVAADEIAHRHPHGNGAVTVAELAIVIHFEPGAHGMVPDGKGVDHGISRLDLGPEEGIKVVLIEAFSCGGTAEAAQTATQEGIFPDIYHPGGTIQVAAEPGDHSSQLGILRQQVCNDHHIALFSFKNLLWNGDADRGSGDAAGIVRLKELLLSAPDQMPEPILRFPAALWGGQVFHIRGQAPDEVHPQLLNVILDVAVGGGVVKMLGGGQLGGDLTPNVNTISLHQFKKAVQLAGLFRLQL